MAHHVNFQHWVTQFKQVLPNTISEGVVDEKRQSTVTIPAINAPPLLIQASVFDILPYRVDCIGLKAYTNLMANRLIGELIAITPRNIMHSFKAIMLANTAQ
jgi:hypothetical protein